MKRPCVKCGREMQVRHDGLVRSHRDLSDQRCAGGGLAPAVLAPEDPHVAVLDETTSEWLRIAAKNLGLTLSEAMTYAACQWLNLPLPESHPLAEEAS